MSKSSFLLAFYIPIFFFSSLIAIAEPDLLVPAAVLAFQSGTKEVQEIKGGRKKGTCDYTAIFNFGDSLSDTGGLFALYARPLPPPNGKTFFGKPTGRFCDGRLLIDFIASSLKFPFPSAYLNSVGANFSTGANFAIAGSAVRNSGGYNPISLDVQIRQFSLFKSQYSLVYKQGENYFSDALYTFDIGGNDFISAYDKNKSTMEIKAAIPDVIQNFKVAIQSVYSEGGRNFWIHNIGPFGCSPSLFERHPIIKSKVDKYGCGVPGNEVAKLYNERLRDAVKELRSGFPLASFVYVDLYSVRFSLFREPHKHGFERPLVACCGFGGKFNVKRGCGATYYVNGTNQPHVCKNPLKRVIWDGVHPTEAANRFAFGQISDGGFSDPPLPISMACHA